MTHDPEYMRLREAGEHIGRKPRTIRRWVAQGRLPNTYRLANRTLYIARADLDALKLPAVEPPPEPIKHRRVLHARTASGRTGFQVRIGRDLKGALRSRAEASGMSLSAAADALIAEALGIER